MKLDQYYSKIKEAIDQTGISDPYTFYPSDNFLKYLNAIFLDDSIDNILKMTRMTILFEGFYKSIPEKKTLKKELNQIRLERWGNHYGTPTINFLLTYNIQIEKSCCIFGLESLSVHENLKPWEIVSQQNFSVDPINSVLVDIDASKYIDMPLENEKTGQFLKTHNPQGGFTTTPCDPVSQKFIEYASEMSGKNITLLEIGAAFGVASLQALAKGAKVFCNDIDPCNLAVVKNRYEKLSNNDEQNLTGDNSKLILIPGSFPHELNGLPKNFFDAILICRVMHFFTGDMIEKSLEQLSAHLKIGGKLFVVCETPFLKNWQRFIPEYENRVKDGVKWPGEITNPAAYESSGRSTSLPKFVHWITKEVLEKSLTQANFGVEHLSYIDRCGQFPKDLLLDGRESIGAVAAKPY